jgi:hypothetical protein
MSNDSNSKNSHGKLPKNFKKPKDFPLNVHAGTGYWCNKVLGHVHYFGKIQDDPKGVAALEQWLEQKDDLLAGRVHNEKSDGQSLRELVNAFLSTKADKRDNGELSPRSFRHYFHTFEIMLKVLGKGRAVSDLHTDDFRKLRVKLSEGRGPASLRCLMQHVRSLFLFAFDESLIRETGQVWPII